MHIIYFPILAPHTLQPQVLFKQRESLLASSGWDCWAQARLKGIKITPTKKHCHGIPFSFWDLFAHKSAHPPCPSPHPLARGQRDSGSVLSAHHRKQLFAFTSNFDRSKVRVAIAGLVPGARSEWFALRLGEEI